MKIRGTPAHIAEKYLSLARDAQASGDPVLAENYLQHAEHYTRIIMAYREQQIQQMGGDPNAMQRRPFGEQGEGGDDFGDDEGDEFGGDFQSSVRGMEAQPRTFDPGSQQQPYGRFDEQGNPIQRPPRHDRPHHQGGGERQGGEGYRQHPREGRDFRHRDNRDHQPREHREPREPREQREFREPREQREPREFREPREAREPREPRERPPIAEVNGQPPVPQAAPEPQAAAPEAAAPRGERRRDRFGQGYEQPEFLRRPVRRPRREAAPDVNGEAPAAPDEATPDKPV